MLFILLEELKYLPLSGAKFSLLLSEYLSCDWFEDSILPVNLRCLNCNTQWRET